MKRVILHYLLIVIILSFSGCSSATVTKNSFLLIKNYRDIPEITESEIDAIEALKKSNTKFTYGQMLETESFIRPDGAYAGFAIKFCKFLSELFEMEFSLELFEWESLINGLNNKSIDFTGDLTPTPERLEFYYMTHPIAERQLRIFTNSENNTILTETDIHSRTIGFLAGAVDAKAVRKYYPELSFNSLEVESFESAVEMLKSGDIDAFVTEGVIDSFFDQFGFLNSREIFPLVYTPVSLATANKELEPIISVINKYLSAGGIQKLMEFYREGEDEYACYKLSRTFSEHEKYYLNDLAINNRTVKVALEQDNYPICFYNKNEKEFQGIAVDILAEISRLTGIKFETANDEKTTWSEILEMLKTGKVSLVSELIHSDERMGRFLWPEKPNSTTNYALISKSNFPDMAIYQVVHTRVGLISKSAYEDNYRLWLPDNNNIVGYDDQNDALDALESGEIDLMMASDYILLMQQNYREKPGYKINIRFGIPVESYFGINLSEHVLCSIINKTQNYIKTDLITYNWSNRGYDYVREMSRQRLIFFMIMAIGMGLALIITIISLRKNRILNRGLDKTVRERTSELEHQTKAAQVASKAKSVFLATMSHEIRTPLNAIIGMAGIAKRSVSNPEKALNSINQILISSHHLLGILNDVLDMSKIDAGKLELSNEPFNFKDAHTEVTQIIKQRCLEKHINFITNIDEIKDCILLGDKLRLNQVLINLLSNAIKFTPENGEIKFIADMLEENEKNTRIHFSVSDSGIGMTQEQVNKLFVPFEQTDTGVAAKFGGTGLGLSISQNLIGMMGGVIQVKSELDVGSEFFFTLSFIKGEKIAEEKQEKKNVNLKGKRILLVEDIEINRIIILELLSPTGVIIEEAENGKLAVEMFGNSPPKYYDLVFMDVQMPVMGGYEATRQIRLLDHADAKNIPIIAMTANAYKEDIEDALASGMNGHISKPLDEEHVMNILSNFIHGN